MRQSINTNTQIQNKAFSLIELSIVLIIIGLLVAGVTGGQSLINSARQRAFINEIKDYEKAIWTFKAARDRYPGDVKNYGTFGYYSNYDDPTGTSTSYARPGYQYKKEDFSAPYNTGSFTPDVVTAPFVDLYTEGIINIKPITENYYNGGKIFKDASLLFSYSGISFIGEVVPTDYTSGLGNFGSIQEVFQYGPVDFNSKFLKATDEKFDDGLSWNGRMRADCSDGEKPNYENSEHSCEYFLYAI